MKRIDFSAGTFREIKGLQISMTTKLYPLFWDIRRNLKEYPKLKQSYLDALDIIHNAGIYHKDIYEDNLVYDEETGEEYFIDFGLSGYFTRRRRV